MNECEQTHPMLRGYIEDTLSARDRRVVARHLNLCAAARKELDRLRSGPVKTPVHPAGAPSEPWDLKALRWFFKTKSSPSPKTSDEVPKKPKAAPKQAVVPPSAAKRSSPWKALVGILVFFGFLVLVTHFVQNAGDSPAVKNVKRWLSKNGAPGVTASLDLVLDLTSLPHWGGNAAPVAAAYHELVTDEDHFKVYWGILQPSVPEPVVDFGKNAVAVVFLGPKGPAGYNVRFKVMKNYSDKTLLQYDEVAPAEIASAPTNGWAVQVVPKPVQEPVLIQKIQ